MVYIVSDVLTPIPRRVQAVHITDGIHEIPNKFFADCHQLKHIILSDDIKTLGNYAFENCRNLEMITLPKYLYSIGKGCFQDCIKLKMMFLPSTLQILRDLAFKGCSDLRCINLPSNLKHVGCFVFFKCRKLEHVTLPQQVTHINSSAFYHCLSLKSITIPGTTMNLGDHCFEGCSSVRWICFQKRSSILEPIMFGECVFALCENLIRINFTYSGVTNIGESCLAGCTNLKQVILEEKTNKISQKAFLNCRSIEYIGYDNLVGKVCWDNNRYAMDLKHITDIEENAFEGCSKLKCVKLYRNQNISSHAFSECKYLSGVSLPGYLKLHNRYCNFFSNNKRITMMKIRTEAKNISFSIAFHVMYEIVKMNPILLEKRITFDGYFPLQVLVSVLIHENRFNDDRPDELCIIRVFYDILRKAPYMINLFLS